MSDVERAVARLSDAGNSRPPGDVRAAAGAASPGLYSWWADATARLLISQVLGAAVGPMIYIGEAGATSRRGNKPSHSTLGSRIVGQHIGGNARSSTFRLTISAILLDPLGLHVTRPGYVSKEDNERVTDWITTHLRVVLCPIEDRDALDHLERQVLNALDPPLNLMGMAATSMHTELSRLRRGITHPEVDIGGAPHASASRSEVRPRLLRDNSMGEHMEYRTQPITAVDISAGRIRIPITGRTKQLFPSSRSSVPITLKGRDMVAKWDPRLGPDTERSGVLLVGRAVLEGLVTPGEVLGVHLDGDVVVIG